MSKLICKTEVARMMRGREERKTRLVWERMAQKADTCMASTCGKIAIGNEVGIRLFFVVLFFNKYNYFNNEVNHNLQLSQKCPL